MALSFFRMSVSWLREESPSALTSASQKGRNSLNRVARGQGMFIHILHDLQFIHTVAGRAGGSGGRSERARCCFFLHALLLLSLPASQVCMVGVASSGACTAQQGVPCQSEHAAAAAGRRPAAHSLERVLRP